MCKAKQYVTGQDEMQYIYTCYFHVKLSTMFYMNKREEHVVSAFGTWVCQSMRLSQCSGFLLVTILVL
jgi:hypothetical protein